MKKLALSLLMSALVVGVIAPPAVAKKAKPAFLGQVVSISESQVTFSVLKANKPGRRWQEANPGDVTAAINEDTRFNGPMRLVDEWSDLRVGDGVKVITRKTDSGLVAKAIKLRLQAYEGTISAYTAGSSISVTWSDANKLGDAWLAANGNPTDVTATITPDTRIERDPDGEPQVGDDVRLKARANGATLDAIAIHASAPATT